MNSNHVTLKGHLSDLARTVGQVFHRGRMIRRSHAYVPEEGTIPSLTAALHPQIQNMVVSDSRRVSPSTLTYVLTPQDPDDRIAPFRAGRYLSVEVAASDGPPISRPYSISNSPADAHKHNVYEITVAAGTGSFIGARIQQDWTVGTPVNVSDPQGFFTWEPLRDTGHFVGIAGGSGVTPFRSIIMQTLVGAEEYDDVPATLVLIQGARRPEELLFDDEFRQLEADYPNRFRRICVLSEDFREGDRQGFIDADSITDAIGDHDATMFICGPEEMHRYLATQLPLLPGIPKLIRREDYGKSGAPTGISAFSIAVRRSGDFLRTITADPGETVLVAMERAGLKPPSSCRNGTCGWCRASLLDGRIRYEPEPAGLRAGDRERSHIHPCTAFPESDLTIEIPEL